MKNIFNVLETPCLVIAAITNILIFVLCGTVNSYSQPNIYVDPCNQVVYGQKTVTVNFRISNVTNVRTYGVSFKFNNSIIKFKSAIKGTFLNNNGSYSTFFGTQPSGTYINDSVTVAESILGAGIAVSGSGLLFSVQFDILSTGQSPISIKGITLYDINNNLITGAFTSGYVTITGKILVVDDEVTSEAKTINPLQTNKKILESPLGTSANLFASSLTSAGYFVEQVNFNSLDTNNLVNYDVVVLSAGIKENLIFNDVTKRTALINYTQAGGKILVEGGEVGYVFRKEEPNDLDPEFRRNILLDSAWISNRIGANLQIVNSSHPIFNTPNVISSPINVSDGGSTGSGARDEMTLHNTAGISRIASWAGGLPENGGIIIYNPNGDTAKCRNIFFTFSIAQFADQLVAGKLIVNSVRYLLRDAFLPAKTLNITSLIEGFYDDTSMIPDTITVELKDTLAPFPLLESKKTVLNNLGYGTLNYTTIDECRYFYIVVKHRNSIETWSNTGKSFNSGSLNYDFTTDSAKAFGYNMKKDGLKWCNFSGDINQDGVIDLTDVSIVDIDNLNFANGYTLTDVNGDNLVDISDIAITDNNNLAFVAKITP